MMFSKRAKDALMTVVSGPLYASSVTGGTNGLVVSVFSGAMPTQEQLDTLYANNVSMSSYPSITDVNGKIAALGNTLLATSYFSTIDVVGLSRTKRKYALSGKTLTASNSGVASFLMVAPSVAASSATAIYLFELGAENSDIMIKSTDIVASQSIYLQDITIDFLLGVDR